MKTPVGFNIYRATSPGRSKTKVNAEIIPANPRSIEGATYSYKDIRLNPKKTSYYWLESTDPDGTTTLDGPLSAELLKK